MRKISKRQAVRVLDGLHVSFNENDIEQFRKGLKVELEHSGVTGGDLELTGLIVLDHLKELPDYYDRLAEMEEGS